MWNVSKIAALEANVKRVASGKIAVTRQKLMEK
jgi:hypothetical protein